jgi:pimeloyl-ACP methyl ester carboxylesterase
MSKSLHPIRPAAFDKRASNLIANPQKHMAENSPMPTKYTDVKGFATHYYYSGLTTLPDVVPDFSRGRKILFLHGAGSNGHTWHRQIDAFGGKHSPLSLDLPGHGRSAGVEGLRTVHDYADFVAAFLDALKIKSAVILGHSMGGAIAMDLALRHAARVDALILSCTAPKFNVTADRIEALRAVTMGRAPQAFNTDGYSPKTAKENFDVVREGWMEQIKTDPRVRYTDILACAVLAGADDQGTTPADAEFIAGKIRGATAKIIADAGHYVPRERPSHYHAAIEQFVDGLK